MTWLRVLRVAFLTAAMAVGVFGLCLNGYWSARLTEANRTWILALPNSPVWAPPATPEYASFRRTFGEALPAPDAPGLSIRRRMEFGSMVGHTLLLLLPVCLMAGLLYVNARDRHRDLALHVALWIGIGMTSAVIASIVLWLILGGWGPSLAGELTLLGMAGGMVLGIRSYRRGPRSESRRTGDTV